MRDFLKAITENLKWKVFSILAAVMLWLVVVDSPQLTATMMVPVEFKNFPAGLDFGSEMPGDVQLQIRGPENAVAASHAVRATVTVDLAKAKTAGEFTFPVADGLVGMPGNVQVVNAIPSQIRLTLEKHVRREVRVRLRVGDSQSSFRVVRSEIEPATVVIAGPESHVLAVGTAVTDRLDFGTIEMEGDEPVIRRRLQTFVEDPRVKIETNPAVTVTAYLQKIRD